MIALMPVALHRALFRRRAMRELVHQADRMLRLGLCCTGVAIVGVLALVFSAVAGLVGAVGTAVLGAALVRMMWLLLPERARRGAEAPHGAAST